MQQAEIRVDLDAIRHNVRLLRAATTAEVMTVVKADGYGHGMVPVARAALDAGATWLGACTLDEALALRAAGITAPVLAWLLVPGLPLHRGVEAGVDLSASGTGLLAELVAAARVAGRPAPGCCWPSGSRPGRACPTGTRTPPGRRRRSRSCRSGTATGCRGTPPTAARCGSPAGGARSPAGCAWTRSCSTAATTRWRPATSRSCSAPVTTASRRPTTGRPRSAPSTTRSSPG